MSEVSTRWLATAGLLMLVLGSVAVAVGTVFAVEAALLPGGVFLVGFGVFYGAAAARAALAARWHRWRRRDGEGR